MNTITKVLVGVAIPSGILALWLGCHAAIAATFYFEDESTQAVPVANPHRATGTTVIPSGCSTDDAVDHEYWSQKYDSYQEYASAWYDDRIKPMQATTREWDPDPYSGMWVSDLELNSLPKLSFFEAMLESMQYFGPQTTYVSVPPNRQKCQYLFIPVKPPG